MEASSLNADASHQTASTSEMFTSTGTNALHGAIWTEFQNAALNALNFATQSPRGPGIPTIGYGYILGGPVYIPKLYDGRNKTFFFTTLQKYKSTFPWNVPLAMPTNAMKGIGTADGGYDLSALGRTICDPSLPLVGGICQAFPGNVIPGSRVSQSAKNALAKYYPNISSSTFFLGNQGPTGVGAQIQPYWDIFVRIDHQISTKDLITGTYVHNWGQNGYNDNTGGNFGPNTTGVFNSTSIGNFLNVSEHHIFSPRLLNEANYAVRPGTSATVEGSRGADVLTALGLPLTPNAPAGITGGPTITISGAASLMWAIQSTSESRTQTYRDVLSFSTGRFTTKAGAEMIRQRAPSASYSGLFGSYNFNGTFTGTGWGDFLLGLPITTSRNNFPGTIGKNNTQWGAFVTENIHATRNLTLDLGVRIEDLYAPIDPYGRGYNFDAATGRLVIRSSSSLSLLNPGLSPALVANIVTASAAGFPDRLVNNLVNVSPRLGIAYHLRGNTVLRAGYGAYGTLLNFGSATGGIFTAGSESYTNVNTCGSATCTPAFTLANPFPGGGTAGVSGLAVSGINPYLKAPVTHQWNLTVEQRLPAEIVLRTSYVGSVSRQLSYQRNLDLPPASTSPFSSSRLVYPSYIYSATYVDSGGNSSYNALDVEFKRPFSKGFTLLGGYSWEKCLSDVDETTGFGAGGPTIEDPYNRAREKGRCEMHPAHTFRALYTWDLPVGRSRGGLLSHPQNLGQKIADQVAGGWTWSGYFIARTGGYFTAYWSGVDSAHGPHTSQTLLRADIVPGCNPIPAHRDHLKMFEPACFTQPANGSYGDAGNGILEGLGVWNYDAGLYKYFHFSSDERMPKLRVAANALNALNHAGWGSSNLTVNAPAGVVAKSSGGIPFNGMSANLGYWRFIYLEARIEW